MTKNYTKEEIEFLIANYEPHGAKYCADLLDRPIYGIRSKATRLNLKSSKCGRNRTWLQEEDNILKNFYETRGRKFCEDLLPNRNSNSIILRASHLKIKTKANISTRLLTHKEYENRLMEMESRVIPLETYINSTTKILHQCFEDHLYYVAPHNILHSSAGCPICAKAAFFTYKRTMLYYIKIISNNYPYYKIGITTKSIEKRYASEPNIEIVSLIEEWYDSGFDAYCKEQEIINTHKTYLIDKDIKVLQRSGNSEVFKVDVLGVDIEKAQ